MSFNGNNQLSFPKGNFEFDRSKFQFMDEFFQRQIVVMTERIVFDLTNLINFLQGTNQNFLHENLYSSYQNMDQYLSYVKGFFEQRNILTPPTNSAIHPNFFPPLKIEIPPLNMIETFKAVPQEKPKLPPLKRAKPNTPQSTNKRKQVSSKFKLFEPPQIKPFQILRQEKLQKIDFSQSRLEDFEFLQVIGTGTFGKVQLCKHKPSKLFLCMKILNKARIVRLNQIQHVKNEREVLSKACNPFIVKLYRTFQDQTNLYLLMEYVHGGELFNFIRQAGMFPDNICKLVAAEIVVALEYLHAKNILYRDLKPENVLIDDFGHVKLADFGFSKVLEGRSKSMCGTPEYIAPEILLKRSHGKEVDWWSLGVLIYEMLAGCPPFTNQQHHTVFEKILHQMPFFPDHFHPQAKNIITLLLQKDPSKRLGCNGANEIKNHPWFQGIQWDKIKNIETNGFLNPNIEKDGDTKNFYKFSIVNTEEVQDSKVDYNKVFSDF